MSDSESRRSVTLLDDDFGWVVFEDGDLLDEFVDAGERRLW